MKYKKKPVVIDAIQWIMGDRPLEAYIELMQLMQNDLSEEVPPFTLTNEGLFIETLEGRMHVSDKDFIIKGVKGEFYPCKPEIFELTYEKN